jgi:hypothetical protein
MLINRNKRPRSEADEETPKRQRLANNADRGRRRAGVEQELLQLPDNFFKRMFRMPKKEFLFLVSGITPILRGTWTSNSQRMAILSSKSEIGTFLQLAATIRWLAGGSIYDIAFGMKISDKTIHHYKYHVMRAVNQVLKGHLTFTITLKHFISHLFQETLSSRQAIHLYAC